MKIAIVHEPLLFSRSGGLQNQVNNIYTELKKIGVDVEMFSFDSGSFSDYDVIHIFDAESCNFKFVEQAKKANKRIVLSSVISPQSSKLCAFRDRAISKLIKLLSRNSLHLTKEQTQWALHNADIVVALGEKESIALRQNYSFNGEISIIPNGVSEDFLNADESLFIEKHKLKPGYMLCVASIYPLKNQLLLAKKTEKLGLKLVLLGEVRDRAYFDEIKKYEHVIYCGLEKDQRVLASAYNASSLVCLLSQHEVMPLVVLEALACNKPLLITDNHSMDMSFSSAQVKEISVSKEKNISKIISDMIDQNNQDRTTKDVGYENELLTWTDVAKMYKNLYEALLNK